LTPIEADRCRDPCSDSERSEQFRSYRTVGQARQNVIAPSADGGSSEGPHKSSDSDREIKQLETEKDAETSKCLCLLLTNYFPFTPNLGTSFAEYTDDFDEEDTVSLEGMPLEQEKKGDRKNRNHTWLSFSTT